MNALEDSILIATRSHRFPSAFISNEIPVAESGTTMDADSTYETELNHWDQWGEEETVQLAEVTFKFDASWMGDHSSSLAQ